MCSVYYYNMILSSQHWRLNENVVRVNIQSNLLSIKVVKILQQQ